MFPTVSDRFIFSEGLIGPIPFIEGWSIAKPVRTMTLKFFGATLVRVHCTKYCILTLISIDIQYSLKITKSQELVNFNITNINWLDYTVKSLSALRLHLPMCTAIGIVEKPSELLQPVANVPKWRWKVADFTSVFNYNSPPYSYGPTNSLTVSKRDYNYYM